MGKFAEASPVFQLATTAPFVRSTTATWRLSGTFTRIARALLLDLERFGVPAQRNVPADPVRVDVAGEEDGLEEENAGRPGGRRASDARQEHLRDHRLDHEQETRADEDGRRPEEAHHHPAQGSAWRVGFTTQRP
jgi:hypothetical protein